MQKQHTNNIVTLLSENEDEGGYDCIVRNTVTGQECKVYFVHDCNEASWDGELFCSAAQAVARLMTEIACANTAFGSGEYEDDGDGLEKYYEALLDLLRAMY